MGGWTGLYENLSMDISLRKHKNGNVMQPSGKQVNLKMHFALSLTLFKP